MLHGKTRVTGAKQWGSLPVAVEIDGARFYSAGDVAADTGVTRQTLWRWRRTGKVPAGYRFRNGQILYTETELQQIRAYANRLEPLSQQNDHQLSIFD